MLNMKPSERQALKGAGAYVFLVWRQVVPCLRALLGDLITLGVGSPGLLDLRARLLREEEVGSWRSLRRVGIFLALHLLLLGWDCFMACRGELKTAFGIGEKVRDSREVVDVASALVSGLDDCVGVPDVGIQ